jgi:ribosomal protein L37AE/L43A
MKPRNYDAEMSDMMQKCQNCSNFMNWTRIWGDLWMCLNCGKYKEKKSCAVKSRLKPQLLSKIS